MKKSVDQRSTIAMAWSFISTSGASLITFALTLVLARLLFPEDYGLVRNAAVFQQFMQLLREQGLTAALVQRKELHEDHINTVFWTSFVVSLVLTGVTYLLAPTLAWWFSQPELTSVIRWMSLAMPIGGLSVVPQALLTRGLNFRSLALRSLISQVGGGILAMLMALAGYGVWSLVGQSLVASFIAVITLWSSVSWRPKFVWYFEKLKELYAFGLYVFAESMLNFFTRRSDDLIIATYLTDKELGLYGLAYSTFNRVQSFTTRPFTSVAFSTLSKFQGDRERIHQWYLWSVRAMLVVAGPPMAFLLITADPLMMMVYGEQWTGTTGVVRALAAVGLLHAGLVTNGPLLLSLGEAKVKTTLTTLRSTTNVSLYFLVVEHGIEAMATAYLCSVAFWTPLAIYWVSGASRLPAKTMLKNLVRPALLVALFSSSVLVISSLPVNQWVRIPAAGLLSYVLFWLAVRQFLPEIYGQASNLVNKRLAGIRRRLSR